jgi:hypothetical protein
MVTGKVINVVSESLKGCRDPELFLRVKYCLLIFIQTLEVTIAKGTMDLSSDMF